MVPAAGAGDPAPTLLATKAKPARSNRDLVFMDVPPKLNDYLPPPALGPIGLISVACSAAYFFHISASGVPKPPRGPTECTRAHTSSCFIPTSNPGHSPAAPPLMEISYTS